jgi:hypothetical protein
MAAWALVGGVAAGAVLWAAANAAARSTIGGPGWSLSGNGALGVLAAGAVVVLGGGWAAIATQRTGRVAVVAAAFPASLIVGLAWGFPFLFPGPSTVMTRGVAPAVLAALSGYGLARLAAGWKRVSIMSLLASLLLIIVLLVVPGLREVFGWLLLPLLLVLPVLTTAGRTGCRGWLLAACVALPVGLVAGVVGLILPFGLG